MKLYYSPGACSLSPHIALHEAGLAHDLVKVDLKAKKTETGEDFTKINPKGQVPALQLDNGEMLTEGPVIVQAIADQVSAKNLAPAPGRQSPPRGAIPRSDRHRWRHAGGRPRRPRQAITRPGWPLWAGDCAGDARSSADAREYR